MAQQWGSGQPGFQYPMQTGFPTQNPGQFQQGFGGGIAPQPTGFPGQGQRPPMFQQPQQTGYPGAGGFQQLQSQPTGYQPGGSGFGQQPPPPVPPLPTNFGGSGFNANPTGGSFLGAPQQPSQLRAPPPLPQRSFLNSSPAFGGGLVPQQTGYPGASPLVPQMTGYVDPRLAMMSNSFMPANPSVPVQGGTLQFAGGLSGGQLQQSIQQYNQEQKPRINWTLTKAEKKNYDQIFRAWDTQSSGFISGQMALEVFGQSGLEKNDLAKVWSLADRDNKGKLNLAEFHVAMGLIYRKLNGLEIPDELPQELIPPSARDLDTSVNFLKDILKHDNSRPSSAGSGDAISRSKVRSFNDTSAPGAGGRKDATVYKYTENDDGDSYYKSRRRHVDRRDVRVGNESPSQDLESMKRQLEGAAQALERATEESSSRTREDEELEREMEDLRYRVKRIQEDLEYVSRGPRSTAKDEERRKLERDLLHLMHERIPEVQKKMEERERRREREKREWTRDRDRRNERFGRYDDKDREYGRYDYDRERERDRSRDREYDRDRDRDYDRDREYERDRPYSRNRERDRSWDREKDRERERERDRDRDRSRPRSPPVAARSPPPPPPPVVTTTAPPPPAAPNPGTSAAPNLKNMTPAERKAYINEQAQRRLQERMRALGVISPAPPSASDSPVMDTTVESRLAQEKKEAEEKARQAEKDAEERERVRRERLENERALKDGRAITPAPVTPTPTSSAAPPAPTPAAAAKPPPPPAPKRAPAPPPPMKRGAAPRPPVSATSSVPTIRAPIPPPALPVASRAPVAPPVVPEEDPEERMLREREERLKKQRAERAERLRQLELEEEEEARRQNEEFERRKQERLASARSPAPSAPVSAVTPAPPPPPPPPAPPAPQLATPSLPTPGPASAASSTSTNPFSKFMQPGSTPTPSAANGGSNPFFRPQQDTSAPPPPPAPPAPPAPQPPTRIASPPVSKSPAPPTVKATYNTVPSDLDDDWDEIQEKEDEDSSDDELNSSRDARARIAQQLFGGGVARPQSAAGSGPSQPQTPVPMSAPPGPPPPQISPQVSQSYATAPTTPVAPPPPPAPAPPAPPAPAAPAAPMAPPPPFAAPVAGAPGDRSALLSSIAAGARLRKTETKDRSAAPVSGRVLGDAAPPPHISTAPRPVSPPAPSVPKEEPAAIPEADQRAQYRQSVDWYAGRAADQGQVLSLPATVEEDEEEAPRTVPDIQVHEAAAPETPDPLEDVDKSKEYRVRALYPYEGQRPEDMSFAENVVIIANPSKSGGAWWYGKTVKEGKSGFFPSTYVQELENVKAKALYSYEGGSADELPFVEGDTLTIVDRSEADWWKTEQGGVIFIVPAAYLEVEGSDLAGGSTIHKATTVDLAPALGEFHNSASYMHEPDPEPVDLNDSSDVDSSDEEYHSFESDSDEESAGGADEQTEEEKRREHEARELERQRVLEAAGILVKKADDTLPPPVRRRSVRKRRPAPETPNRLSVASASSGKDLPPTPSSAVDHALQIDDAFERYEAYRQSKNYRLSMSSIDTGPPSPGSLPPSLSATPSKDGGESRTSTSHSAIFSFFTGGRSKTPTSDPDKPRLQISAPIMINGNSSDFPSREGSPAFGTSWASLINREALEGIPTQERKRQEAIFELINTESAYVRDLQLIVEIFFSSMLSLLDSKEVTLIFANIQDILLVNTTFLSSLEEKQKECRLYIDTIGDLLERHMVNMDVYTDYCVNHGNAIKILQAIRQKRPEVASHLQRLRDDPSVRNLDLSSYLLAPMQRITRYPLLIKQILHHTQGESDKKRISTALSAVERVLTIINESIREQESRERLAQVSRNLYVGQGRLDLTKTTNYMGPRRLIKEGLLMKYKSGRRLCAFLCNDMLILTDEGVNRLYKMPIQLDQVDVRELSSKDDLAFQLVFSYPRGGETLVFKTFSARDCDTWIKAISSASRRARDIRVRASRKVAEYR